MDVKVIIDNSDTIQQHIIANKIDLGLIEGIVKSPHIIGKHFRDDDLVMICANSHSIADKTDIEVNQIKDEKEFIKLCKRIFKIY